MLTLLSCPSFFEFGRTWADVRKRLVAWGLLVLVGSGAVVVPAGAQSLDGEVATVSANQIRVELADSLNVTDGTEGRVVQQRTVGGRTVQMTFAVVVVEHVERPAEGPWVAVGRIERRSEDIEVGNDVRFADVERRAGLAVRSDPAGARVFLDGEPMGSTPVRRSLAAGTYEVRLEKEGYTPTVLPVDVAPGDRREMMPTLQEATGTLVVNTLPEDATVEFGDEGLGQTPLQTDVRAGTDTLRVRREGYLAMERTVEVQRDEETRLNLVLRRPFEVQLADRQVTPVDNVRLHREKDQLVVQYDLDGDSDEYEVEFLLSTNGGATFDALPEAVTGDVGKDVTPGSDRQIVWRVLEDFPNGIRGSGNRLRVSAEAEGGRGVFWVLGSAIVVGGGATAAALLGMFQGGTNGGGDLPNSPPTPPE